MDVFHLVIDTSMFRRLPFQHADFKRLLMQSQMGTLKIYMPHIVLEEERTAQLANHATLVEQTRSTFEKLQRGMLGMLVEGLPEPYLGLWDLEDVKRNSQQSFDRFVKDNKIEVIAISPQHADNAWRRYFDAAPPFNPNEKRENRRKDIPDSWILEAGMEIKSKDGRHCALVDDNKLTKALEAEGFKVYSSVEALLDDIEQATSVTSSHAAIVEEPPVPLNQLRGPAFKDLDVIVLGMNEALNTPSKHELFSVLESAGLDRAIAEHEARTLVLSGRLNDTGSHLIPTSRQLAREASRSDAVVDILLKVAL